MANALESILSATIGQNTINDYTASLLIFIAVVAALRIFKFVIIKGTKKIASRTETDVDDLLVDALDNVHWYFYVLVALFMALQTLKTPEIINSIFYFSLVIGAAYNAVIIAHRIIDHISSKVISKKQKENGEDTYAVSVIETLTKISKFVLWVIASLFILSSLGYNISTVLAGLSIGGIAIAFAMQNVLSDIFSWFTIYFDKPFRIGDFIVIGTDAGVVKKIGVKSTRLQTLQGEELIVSNRELTSVRVQNFKHMEKRRAVFNFGLVYQTSNQKINKALEIVKTVVDELEITDLDRVHFKKFGDSSLDFEVVYYINSNDYKAYMDTQQTINMSIKEKFEKEKIEFAYPTRTIYTNK